MKFVYKIVALQSELQNYTELQKSKNYFKAETLEMLKMWLVLTCFDKILTLNNMKLNKRLY